MDYLSDHDPEQSDVKMLVEQYEEALANNRQPIIAEETVEQIVEYYENFGHYDKALQIINTALDHFPYSGQILWKKAQLLYDLKICDEALDCLDKAELFEPGEIGMVLLRSEIMTFQSRHEECIELLSEAFKQASKADYPGIWLHMADAYEDWEKYPEVYNCLCKCLMAEPQNMEALNRMNYCMEIADRFEDAIKLHKDILEEHPFNHWVWYNLACAYAGMELYEKAIDALLYVTAIDENLYYAYRDLAQHYHELGAYVQALESIKTYTDTNKADADMCLLEGKCHFELSELKASRFCFRKAIRLQPSANEAFYNLAMTYIVEEKWKQAAQNLRKAIELAPDNSDYLLRLAEVAIQMEEFDEARYCCSRAIRLNAHQHKIYINLALTYLFSEEEDEAIKAMEKGIQAMPESVELLYVKAILLLITNRRKAAYLELESVLTDHPDQYGIMFRYFPFLRDDVGLIALLERFDIAL